MGYLPRVPPPIVAIDGPAGAGKSTVARQLARRLGFAMIDTGAIYRSVALAARRAGIAWDDDTGLRTILEPGLGLSFLPCRPSVAGPHPCAAPGCGDYVQSVGCRCGVHSL